MALSILLKIFYSPTFQFSKRLQKLVEFSKSSKLIIDYWAIEGWVLTWCACFS